MMNLSKLTLQFCLGAFWCGIVSIAAAESVVVKQVVTGTSAGDTPGEEQPPPSGYPIQAAPPLSPAEALKTLKP